MPVAVERVELRLDRLLTVSESVGDLGAVSEAGGKETLEGFPLSVEAIRGRPRCTNLKEEKQCSER